MPLMIAKLRRLEPSTVVAVGVFISVAAKNLVFRLRDPDLWWHMLTGRVIASQGIPKVDPYSFTAAGRDWVVQEWGSELIFHHLQSAMGLRSLIVLRALCLLILVAITSKMIVRYAGNNLASWALIGLVTYAGAANWTERANLFSFIFVATTLQLILSRSKTLWWFVPLAAIWANLHGMVLIGLGMVAVVAITEWLKVWLHLDNRDPRFAGRVSLVFGAGLLSSFLNPVGPKLIWFGLNLVRSVSSQITEWASPDFTSPDALLFMMLVVVMVVVLARSPARPDLTDLGLASAFLALALLAWRNMTISSVVLGVTIARYGPGAMRELFQNWPRATKDVDPVVGFILSGAALTWLLIALVVPVFQEFPTSDSLDAVADPYYPTGILEDHLDGKIRLFAQEDWSGMALYLHHPQLKVAIDGRADMYGPALIDEFARIREGDEQWPTYMKKHCITHVLLDEHWGLSVALRSDADWRITEEEQILSSNGIRSRAVLFERRSPSSGCH